MEKGKEFKVIGLMSGTSMDGLDIACCTFRYDGSNWDWYIDAAETVPYPIEWLQRLRAAMQLSGEELSRLHIDLGAYIGECVTNFIRKGGFSVDLIGSHGHTVFHQPANRLTLQIGAGTEIYAACQVPVICDFRILDMAFGGQGAPLVPIGDRLLFGDYDACLNLGGIANISYEVNGQRIAFDICPCNMPLNNLAAKAGKSFDEGGKTAASGNILEEMLSNLNALSYYQLPAPKSLGQEYVDSEVLPLIKGENVPDLLRTSVEHTAIQVANCIRQADKKNVLATGGGVFNDFLIERIRLHLGEDGELILPEPQVISYKEALVFAFLAVLKINGLNNVLSSVTGAVMDTSSGVRIG